MGSDFSRPKGKTELEDREAAGLWNAIALANKIGESKVVININVIKKINETILKDSVPESAGKFRTRGQDVNPLPCIEPPLGTEVYSNMVEFEKNLIHKFTLIPKFIDKKHKKIYRKWVDDIFDLASWIQHQIVAIRPFCDANGRTARLMTNIILKRFNFPLSDIKHEGDDKKHYLDALCRIDKCFDYRPLKNLIFNGSINTLKKEAEKRRKLKK
jgi:prophage maintenance system killer protein